MGWKSLKEHYGIEHIVHVRGGAMCIGSPYVPDIIKISLDRGEIIDRGKLFTDRPGSLADYLAKMDADPFKLAELVAAKDVFETSITVYTSEGGAILEKQCEELGYPNVTHDGELMYDNTFSPDYGLVLTWAIDNAQAGIEARLERLAEITAMEREAKAMLNQRERDLAALLKLRADA